LLALTRVSIRQHLEEQIALLALAGQQAEGVNRADADADGIRSRPCPVILRTLEKLRSFLRNASTAGLDNVRRWNAQKALGYFGLKRAHDKHGEQIAYKFGHEVLRLVRAI
jgi:hypothetical protein